MYPRSSVSAHSLVGAHSNSHSHIHVDPSWQRLPLHPPPQPLESQTSYFLRVASVNRLNSLKELGELAGEARLYNRMVANPDAVLLATSGFTSLTGCTHADLSALTLVPLGHRFDRARSLTTLQSFLTGSLAPHLRYCPQCLAEHEVQYYSILWRFQSLTGCPTHRCKLLDHCCHCGSYLANVPLTPQLAVCPACETDLRTCQAPRLSKQEAQPVGRRFHDLELLVNACSTELGSHLKQYVQTENWSKDLAHCYAARRQSRGITLQEAAAQLAIGPQLLLAIESPGLSQKVTLHAYLQYADLLGCTFSSLVFEAAARSGIEESEDNVLAQVDEVMIETLRQVYCTPADGQLVVIPPVGAIAQEMGLPILSLKQFPRVKTRLNAWKRLRQYALATQQLTTQAELVFSVHQAIRQIKREKKRLSQKSVTQQVGLNVTRLRDFPQVEAVLIRIACKHPSGKNQSRLVSILDRLPAF